MNLSMLDNTPKVEETLFLNLGGGV